MKDIVIVGAGGFGRELTWLIEDINKVASEWNLVGYIDDNKEIINKKIDGYEVIGDIESLVKMGVVNVALGIGSPKVKESIINRLRGINNIRYPNLIHPSTIISPRAQIGIGNIICAGNVVSINSKIYDYVTINLSCTIGHDVHLFDFVTVSPGTNISGYVKVGEKSDLGTGSCIIQNVNIGNNSIIGAGSVVIRDIPDNCTAVGNPAKVIKR